jgi:hypothetical protein
VSPRPRRGENRFGLALRAVNEALAVGKTSVAVIGGIALNANGVTRSTADIDVTIPGADLDLAGVLRRLKAHEIVPRIPNARAFARANQVLLLRHAPTRIDMDVSLAWISFELEAIARAQRMTFATVRIRVARRRIWSSTSSSQTGHETSGISKTCSSSIDARSISRACARSCDPSPSTWTGKIDSPCWTKSLSVYRPRRVAPHGLDEGAAATERLGTSCGEGSFFALTVDGCGPEPKFTVAGRRWAE